MSSDEAGVARGAVVDGVADKRATALGVQASAEHAELAEEWMVTFAAGETATGEDCGGGELFREWEEGAQISHKLPEARPGQNLTEAEARAFATKVMAENGYRVYRVDQDEGSSVVGAGGMIAHEKKAKPIQHPTRVDWEFQFSCSVNDSSTSSTGSSSTPLVLTSGDARVSLVLSAASSKPDSSGSSGTSGTSGSSGSSVGGPSGNLHTQSFRKWVKVPEAWIREDENERQAAKLVGAVSNLASMLFVICGAGFGLYRWATDNSADSGTNSGAGSQRGRTQVPLPITFSSGIFFRCFLLVFSLHLCNGINRWPQFASSMRSAQPVSNQLVSHAGSALVKALLHAVMISLALAFAHCQPWRQHQQPIGSKSTGMIGMVGMAPLVALSAICIGCFPSVGARVVDGVLTTFFSPPMSLSPASCDESVMGSWSTAVEMGGR
jgi:hypothetical protein